MSRYLFATSSMKVLILTGYLYSLGALFVLGQSFELPPETARSSGYGVDDRRIFELLDEKLSPCKLTQPINHKLMR